MYEKQMELFEDGGLKDEGGMVDEESGNDVPVGSTRKEVRDDIPAMLSEGEFVFPADVVRYVGLDKLMQIRQEAKMGLKQMEAMGQMGNSDEATIPDDEEYPSLDILVLTGKEEDDDKIKELAEGGFLKAQAGTFVADTGLGEVMPSSFDSDVLEAEQADQFDTFIPPSSMTPPEPIPAPAGGFRPKFLTDTGTTPTSTVTKPITPSIETVTQQAEETKFVPEVQDKYKPIKYINPETGEIRDFYFYNGNPITPIPDGFIPYAESTDEEVDDLESTTVESTTVRQESDDDSPFVIDAPEPVDYTKYSRSELMAAFDENKNARLALTAMGAVNPLIAVFGRFATKNQEKNIIAEMEKRGIKPPETSTNILDRISDMVSNIFGKDKEKVKRSISTTTSTTRGTSPRPVLRPTTVPKVAGEKTESMATRVKEDRETQQMLDNLRSKAIQATASTSVVKEKAKETGMTPVQVVAKANKDDKPTFAPSSTVRESADPRGTNQRGNADVNTVATNAAVAAEKTAPKKETIEQKIKRGGGFKKGGLASRKKKKK